MIMFFLLGLFFYLIEIIKPAQKTPFNKKELNNDLIHFFLHSTLTSPLCSFIIKATVIVGLDTFIPKSFKLDFGITNFYIELFLALLIMDIVVYIRHLIQHKFFWNYHSIHHSAEEITWLTKFKGHPIDILISLFFTISILYFFGFSPTTLILASYIATGIDLFNHANIDLAWPRPFCYLFASPNYHKWHHAKQKEAIDKNLVLIFPFIDKIFGTYHMPKDGKPPKNTGILGIEKKKINIQSDFIEQMKYPYLKE